MYHSCWGCAHANGTTSYPKPWCGSTSPLLQLKSHPNRATVNPAHFEALPKTSFDGTPFRNNHAPLQQQSCIGSQQDMAHLVTSLL
jgi:hypothetical protein